MEFGLYELPEYSKRHYAFVVIQEFENVDLSAYPIIANMVDGQIKDKTITVPIVIVSTIVPHNKTFMQRFKYFEMKY